MQKLTLSAPAKLNLALDVVGAAPDGYHALDMVMQAVSLCDTVTLEEAEEIGLDCPDWLPAGPGNLAWRAAERLRDFSGVRKGARITLEKRIPAQAGLGGGSADAAAVLKGLNTLWELGLNEGELLRVGLTLGADVPFALTGGTARVRGVGEEIEPITGVKPLWFVLAKPAGGVGTAEAYRMYDEEGAGARPAIGPFIGALQKGNAGGMALFGGNALERAAAGLLPAIGELLEKIRAAGTAYAAMTGSGSAVFGVFQTESEAIAAKEKLSDIPWTAIARSFEPPSGNGGAVLDSPAPDLPR